MKLTIKTEIQIVAEPTGDGKFVAWASDVNHPQETPFEAIDHDPGSAMKTAARELMQYVIEANVSS